MIGAESRARETSPGFLLLPIMRGVKLTATLLLAIAALTARAADIPSPSQHLKMSIGADKTLADYRQMTSYFRMLDAASPRVEVEVLGKTTLGEEMIMAVISSEENLRNKARIKESAKQLADPRGLSDADAGTLGARRQSGRARHLQHPLDRDRSRADGHGVGARAGDRRTTPRRSGASTTSCCCSSRRSIPTGRS